MDKEVLAIIGKLYLENIGLINFTESLKNKISELEKQLSQDSDS